MKKEHTFALAGNPNSGKTTLFNELTGSSQAVGNWPGVTVERKTGRAVWEGGAAAVVDLPGVYSLSPYSPEERLAGEYLESGAATAIINVVDASHIERNLYLTTQLMEKGLPLVVALNMMDVVEERREKVDVKRISQELGVPVVPVCASRGRGVNLALAAAAQAAGRPAPRGLVRLPPPGTKDKEAAEAGARYDFVCGVVQRCFYRPETRGKSASERADTLLTNRWAAIPLFFLIVLAVFFLTFGPPGNFLGGCMNSLAGFCISAVSRVCAAGGVTPWISSLLTNGVLSGLGAVLRFLPQILLLFLCLSLLEDSGYMARAAFIMDAPMRRLGLSGRAFVPLLMGFGCTVPAVMGTRILENEKDKRLTVLIMPFFSCSAKMPVYSLLIGSFFAGERPLVLFALYGFGVLFAVFSALLFKNTILQGKAAPFVLELPDYRMPTLKTLWLHVWQRLRDFLAKAGSVILLASLLVWFLQSFSPDFSWVQDNSQSILAYLGRALAPVFTLCGFGSWKPAVALLSGLVAKESVAGTLGVLCGGDLTGGLQGMFTPLSAFSFLLFVLLYTPCVAALSAIRREMGSMKWTCFTILWQLFSAWFVSALFYQWGVVLLRLFG